MFLALDRQDVIARVRKWCDLNEQMYPSDTELNDLIKVCERRLVRKLVTGKSANYRRELLRLLTRLFC